eukprot:207411_1
MSDQQVVTLQQQPTDEAPVKKVSTVAASLRRYHQGDNDSQQSSPSREETSEGEEPSLPPSGRSATSTPDAMMNQLGLNSRHESTGARVRGRPKGVQRCSKCQRPGHNRRNCKSPQIPYRGSVLGPSTPAAQYSESYSDDPVTDGNPTLRQSSESASAPQAAAKQTQTKPQISTAQVKQEPTDNS